MHAKELRCQSSLTVISKWVSHELNESEKLKVGIGKCIKPTCETRNRRKNYYT